jgi:thioredoxin 1
MGVFKALFSTEVKPGMPRETTDATFDNDILKSDLPVLLDFWSPTCQPCHVMGGLLRELGPEYAGRVNIFKLNVARDYEVASAFRIHSIPTLMFIKDGKIVDQVVGLIPLDMLRRKLDQLAPLPLEKVS